MRSITHSPKPSDSDRELQSFERLTAAVALRVARVDADEIGPAIEGALEQVVRAVEVDAGALVEFTGSGDVNVLAAWPARGAIGGPFGSPNYPPPWLLDRLSTHELLVVSSIEDLPIADQREARHAGVSSVLGVPVFISDQPACALVIWSWQLPRAWSATLIERARSITQIFGLALQRCRHAGTRRKSLETLNMGLAAETVYLNEEIKVHHDFDNIVGESVALRGALTRLAHVAPTTATVLLLGETGTGKELFARAVHDRSRRRTRTLIRVNCAALPPSLIESELFGHEKGAFTGALSMRQGRFELADGGTIFLDEIGDLPSEIQVKLLRVLQEGEFERVGSCRTRKVDVRVIAATHRDLEADVAAGRFRADLYYRLSVYPIAVPPLRERREDIPVLVWFFIHRRQRELGRRITKVPEATMDLLKQHVWPGNVRELENVIERALISSTGDTLQLDTFGRVREPLAKGVKSIETSLEAVERGHIEAILRQCSWRINGANNAAERLALHPNTLRFRMNKLGIVRPDRIDQDSGAGSVSALN